MSGHPSRESRRRRRGGVPVEPLEGRALLSRVAPVPVRLTNPAEILNLQTPSPYINQQEGSFAVTINPQRPVTHGKKHTYQNTALDQPLTVNVSASLASTGAPDSSVSSTAPVSGLFAPFNETITIPAGVSTETVIVPIVSSAAAAGPVKVVLSATPSSPSAVPVATRTLELYSGPDSVPPTITSAHLTMKGRLASGIVIGFNKPMALAKVEDNRDYHVTGPPRLSTHLDLFNPASVLPVSTSVKVDSFPLKAAQYDATTMTVTLTLKKPVPPGSLFAISSAKPLGRHVLTDLQGNPLAQTGYRHGAFSVDLRTA